MTRALKRIITRVKSEASEQRRVLPWVIIAATLLNLTNLLAVFIPLPTMNGLLLLVHSMAVFLFLGVFGIRARTLLLWLTPFLLMIPAGAAYLLATKTLPSTFTFMALLETNKEELSAFYGQAISVLVMAVFLSAGYVFLVKRMVPRDFKMGLAAKAALVAAIVIPTLSDLVNYGPQSVLFRSGQRLTTTFPTGTFFSAAEALSLRKEITDRSSLMRNIVLQQQAPAGDANQRQVNVLVIGESARYDSFQINGYKRPTTPGLCSTAGILSFKDVCATAPITLAAVPQLLTHSEPGNVRNSTRLPSLLQAYRKAGYKVYWLSAQPKHGIYDTMTSLYAADADKSVFLDSGLDAGGRGAGVNGKDWQLLPIVKNIMSKNETKVLIVLHTMGSHGPYYNRYPVEFDKFPVSREAFTNAQNDHILKPSLSPEDCRAMTDAYDNTICLTDFILTSLIRSLQDAKTSSWLYYISDHGENGGDAEMASFAHGTFTKDVLHVPMFVWMSPQYREGHPRQVAALEKHTATPFSAACTYHTILDLGGLRTGDMIPAWSVAATDFKPGPRLICTTRDDVSDYDKDVLPMLNQRSGWHPFIPHKIAAAAALGR